MKPCVCGKQLGDNATLCPSCGQRFPSEAAKKVRTGARWTLYTICGIIAIPVVFFLGGILWAVLDLIRRVWWLSLPFTGVLWFFIFRSSKGKKAG